jgi:hypothetical protein
MTRGHLALALVVALGLPLASRLWGNGELTFSMFSGSGSYRLRFETVDAGGRARPLAPTAVAAAVRGSVGDMLAGTERFRHGPFGSLLRRRLGEVARFACAARPGAVRARAMLDERRTLDAPVTGARADEACP